MLLRFLDVQEQEQVQLQPQWKLQDQNGKRINSFSKRKLFALAIKKTNCLCRIDWPMWRVSSTSSASSTSIGIANSNSTYITL